MFIQQLISNEIVAQWQAGSRQQAAPSGFEPDKSSWGWNWLERWMAVRPWENRFLDINLKDGVMVRDNGSTEGKNGSTKPVAKKPITSNIHSSLSSHKTGPSNSDGSSASPGKSASVAQPSSNPQLSKSKSKPRVEEGSTKPTGNLRSQSNPKERAGQSGKQMKKRMSLPNSGEFVSLISFSRTELAVQSQVSMNTMLNL